MKKIGLSILLVAAHVGLQGRVAHANDAATYGSGPMKNLYIDLIFWGDMQQSDRDLAIKAVNDVAAWVNGSSVGARQEAAVRYYGVTGLAPGRWVVDPNAIPSKYLASTPAPFGLSPDDNVFSPVVAAAHAGSFGAVHDFQGNVTGDSALPSGSNRLALVITNKTQEYCISVGQFLGNSCVYDWGYHSYSTANAQYGAVMYEHYYDTIWHEVFESMTDPVIFNGWTTNTGLFSTAEMADECSSGNITYDPPFVLNGTTVPAATCQYAVPSQHAPLAAAFEYGTNGCAPLYVFYTTTTGHINALSWCSANGSAGGPYDLGQPSPTVTAVGKPAAVYSLYGGGEAIFVKGSDNAVWVHMNNAWKSLGGQIFGDVAATAWNWNNQYWMHVIVLGTDDHLYSVGLLNGVPQSGWGQVPTGNVGFVGSPAVTSRAPNTLDIVAVGEDGGLKRIVFNNSTGWGAPVSLYTVSNDPLISTPAIIAQGGNLLQIADTSFYEVWQTSWNESTQLQMQNYNFAVSTYDKSFGFQGTPAITSWGTNRFDMFSVTRNGKLFWWYTTGPTGTNYWYDGLQPNSGLNPPALVDSGASGDPVAVSRFANEMEVFYRTAYGALVHLTYLNGTWTTQNLLSNNSIQ